MGYVKAQSIKCHYHFDPDCPMCHGNPDYRNEHGLPCECGLENMTFDEPEEVLMEVASEPLPDGGMRVHMREVKPEEN